MQIRTRRPPPSRCARAPGGAPERHVRHLPGRERARPGPGRAGRPRHQASGPPATGTCCWAVSRSSRLTGGHAESKSMRTATAARRRGVAGRLLDHVLAEARSRGHDRISLETGTEDYFAAARALYATRGFTHCAPFEGYAEDPHSVFLSLAL
ncbi:GNAT family N-acetyltransferase [Nocardioides convexus]|uniref:GNAT family N-acetyltransferase n=1 Tax=Nocardioides convexus TaxID=2712224 RepID=UPI0024181A83|nr:GNAT family N-acetyltransferase [Nocardioides convexus]